MGFSDNFQMLKKLLIYLAFLYFSRTACCAISGALSKVSCNLIKHSLKSSTLYPVLVTMGSSSHAAKPSVCLAKATAAEAIMEGAKGMKASPSIMVNSVKYWAMAVVRGPQPASPAQKLTKKYAVGGATFQLRTLRTNCSILNT